MCVFLPLARSNGLDDHPEPGAPKILPFVTSSSYQDDPWRSWTVVDPFYLFSKPSGLPGIVPGPGSRQDRDPGGDRGLRRGQGPRRLTLVERGEARPIFSCLWTKRNLPSSISRFVARSCPSVPGPVVLRLGVFDAMFVSSKRGRKPPLAMTAHATHTQVRSTHRAQMPRGATHWPEGKARGAPTAVAQLVSYLALAAQIAPCRGVTTLLLDTCSTAVLSPRS